MQFGPPYLIITIRVLHYPVLRTVQKGVFSLSSVVFVDPLLDTALVA